MMHPDPHISDELILLALDGELDDHTAVIVTSHLRQCASCLARRTELARSGTLLARHWQQQNSPPEISAGSLAAAAQLRAKLAAMPHTRPAASQWFPSAAFKGASAGAALLLFTWLGLSRLAAPPPNHPLPDSRFTPGAARLISREQACRVSPPQDESPLVRPELARKVFAQYQISKPTAKTYEIDFLISPALGGAEDDVRNLWPVPYAEGEWTSRVKDALEDRLYSLVCQGSVDIATAQREIAADWIAAYRRYFRTQQPLATHASFVKDSPWN